MRRKQIFYIVQSFDSELGSKKNNLSFTEVFTRGSFLISILNVTIAVDCLHLFVGGQILPKPQYYISTITIGWSYVLA